MRFLTLLLLISCPIFLFGQQVEPTPEQIQELVSQLGNTSFKTRNNAIKELIKYGYFSRTAVERALNADDPEIRENAKIIWEKIRWAILKNHPEMVSQFIEDFQKNKATEGQWYELVKNCGAESLLVLLETFTINPIENNKNKERGEVDPLLDQIELNGVDAFVANPFVDNDSSNNLSLYYSLKVYLFLTTAEEQQKILKTLNEVNKAKFYELVKQNLSSYDSHLQLKILKLTTEIHNLEKSYDLLNELPFDSNYLLKNLPPSFKEYALANLNKFTGELKLKTLIFLGETKACSNEDFQKQFHPELFKSEDLALVQLFYHKYSQKIPQEKWLQAFSVEISNESQKAYYKYQILKLQNKTDEESLKKEFGNYFKNQPVLDEFIQTTFDKDDEQAIFFYKIFDSLKNLDPDTGSGYSAVANEILMNHYEKMGDFAKAKHHAGVYITDYEIENDKSVEFFEEQAKKINEETRQILLKVHSLYKTKPEEALTLLNKAETLSPAILTIKVQKIELLLELTKVDEAKKTFDSLIPLIPKHVYSDYNYLYLAWKVNDDSLIEKTHDVLQQSKSEEDGLEWLLMNSYELLGKMDKVLELRTQIDEECLFTNLRNSFYKNDFTAEIFTQELKSENYIENSEYLFLWKLLAQKFLGKNEEAKKILLQDKNSDISLTALYLCGYITEEAFLAESQFHFKKDVKNLALNNAYFYIACNALVDKNKEKAKTYFQKCLDLKLLDDFYFKTSGAMLRNLKNF